MIDLPDRDAKLLWRWLLVIGLVGAATFGVRDVLVGAGATAEATALLGIAAAAVLYLAISSFNLTWIYQTAPAGPGVVAFLTSPGLFAFYAVTAGLGGLGVLVHRRLGRERRNLHAMRPGLDEQAVPRPDAST